MDVIIREAQPDDAKQIIHYGKSLAEEPVIYIALSPGEFNMGVDEEQKFILISSSGRTNTRMQGV